MMALKKLKFLEGILFQIVCKLIKAKNGIEALSIFNKTTVYSPFRRHNSLYGWFEVCNQLKASEVTKLIPVLHTEALNDREAKIKGIDAEAGDSIKKSSNKMERLAWAGFLIKLKRLNDYIASVEYVPSSLARTVKAEDRYTKGHVERVSKIAIILGRNMALTQSEKEAFRFLGILHYFGKIIIPEYTLNKPGPLNPKEAEVIKSKPVAVYNICLPLKKFGSSIRCNTIAPRKIRWLWLSRRIKKRGYFHCFANNGRR
jgi:response regulator RpfG family c-di-GMP phosphodiesterase